MNKDQFIYWLKGFVDAAKVSPTQVQWGIVKEKLDEIKDCPDFGSPISDPNIFPRWQEPHYQYPQGPHYQSPSDINKITYDGTGNDNIALCGTAKVTNVITTEGNTSITTKLFPGTTLTYTTNDSKDSKN